MTLHLYRIVEKSNVVGSSVVSHCTMLLPAVKDLLASRIHGRSCKLLTLLVVVRDG